MSGVRAVVVVAVGAYVFERLRIPAGALIGAMVAAAVLNLSAFELPPLPEWVRFASFAAIGWLLGAQFTHETLTNLRSSLGPIALVVVTLVTTGVVLAIVLQRLGIDAATAYLAATPAGISQMAAMSVDVGADAALVVSTHLVRVITVVTITPFIVRAVLE